MVLERRLAALEASLSPHASTGARERLASKLASIAEAHRTRRGQQGGDGLVDLEGQSVASLLALIRSYPYGAVPFDVAYTATRKARALNPIAAKLVQMALERRGYDRGI